MDDLIRAKLNVQGVIGAVVSNGVLKTCKTAPVFLTIPKEVKKLGSGCLSGQNTLEVLHLPKGVEIDKYALANCNNLRIIKCPDSLSCYEKNLKYGNSAEVIYVHSDK
jgi:hypothetical protein